MAYQRADPAPFVPHGFQLDEITNREFMVRVVAPVRPEQPSQENAAWELWPAPQQQQQAQAQGGNPGPNLNLNLNLEPQQEEVMDQPDDINQDELVGSGEDAFPQDNGFPENEENHEQAVEMQEDHIIPEKHGVQEQPAIPEKHDHQHLNVQVQQNHQDQHLMIPVQQHNAVGQPVMLPDLNNEALQQEGMEIDLNMPANQQGEGQEFDQQEVIFNPAQPVNDFIKLNDFGDANMIEEEIQIQQPVLPQHPDEDHLMALSDELHQILPLPVIPDLLGEKIGLDQLMGTDDLEENQDEEENGNHAGAEEPEENPAVADGLGLPENLDVDQQQLPEHGKELNEQQLQVGMALMPNLQFDPVFMEREVRQRALESSKLWEAFFGQGNPGRLTVTVPTNWFYFFSSLLLSPDNFGWAKDFLTSKAPEYLAENSDNVSLLIPTEYPSNASSPCFAETSSTNPAVMSMEGKQTVHIEEITDNQVLDSSPSNGGTKKRKSSRRTTPLLETQVLSLLPSYEGKSVLELGAGIGRFTGELAKTSGHVFAVDFIESVIKKLLRFTLSPDNENINGHYDNTSFMCADVTSPDLMIEANSIDMIFSNWLLMYLSDEEICWLWQKVNSSEDGGFQSFLDNVQYKATGILRYERIFGDGYVSTGGAETTKEFVDKLNLKPGQKVLDVGCGIGGGDFYMAEKYGTHVVGIDLSINMILFALERSIGRKCPVEFEVADCTTKTYPDHMFDVIYSRDTIIHIQDKPSLFKSFFKWLKPGGKVLISDYCKSPGKPSEVFAAYIKQRGYDLHDVEAYGQMLKNAGFSHVIAEDRTDQFLSVLQKELDKFEKNKDDFLSEFARRITMIS
ncbi:unnamed protein product [Miscanthus lutarioriparius]|uniref:phosphoethanolamine N-methyltransferase n=1 Tax=Miscanthus lutarioriparius TaxID=422564 RepID=A0A811P0T5_9POAL|nr:unnamed protein product [Miscanthus lutarioriparius]